MLTEDEVAVMDKEEVQEALSLHREAIRRNDKPIMVQQADGSNKYSRLYQDFHLLRNRLSTLLVAERIAAMPTWVDDAAEQIMVEFTLPEAAKVRLRELIYGTFMRA